VAARTSAFSFKGRNADLRSIGDQLTVATVLEGSVRRAGGRIRITAQLINVADGYHLWSERYDRELTDVFAIQDEIATAIAEKLKVTLRVSGESRLVRPPTANVEAYELLLKGRALNRQRGPSLLRALEAYEEAIALDGRLAVAHAELAQSLILLSLYGLVRPTDIRERCRAATSRALELEPDLATAHLVLGLNAEMVEFDRAGASRAYARAVELDPLDADARSIQAAFDFCYLQGNFPLAHAQLREIIQADPLNTNALGQLSIALAFASQSADATDAARRAIALDANSFYAHWALLNALMLGPDPGAAIEAGRAMLSRFARHPWLLMGMAYAHGAAGRRELAEAFYGELVARAQGEYVQPMAIAVAAIGTGQGERLFRHLREAAQIRDPLLTAMALRWPGLAPYRAMPEFADLLGILGWADAVG
jgi:serine/threonine-protein kinase